MAAKSPPDCIDAPPGLVQSKAATVKHVKAEKAVKQEKGEKLSAKSMKASKSPVTQAPGLASPPSVMPSCDLPPGLMPPPGLEDVSPAMAEPAAVAVTTSSKSSDWEVIITGLPSKLMSQAMLEAMLQQAGLDGMFSNLTVHAGRPYGQVHVNFASAIPAQRCVNHFQGCQWDKSGPAVCAQIVPPAVPLPKLQSIAKKQGKPNVDVKQITLSANAPSFEPSWVALSAEAPEFVPAAFAEAGKTSLIACSDTSTDMGDSEDDKNSPRTRAYSWNSGSNLAA